MQVSTKLTNAVKAQAMAEGLEQASRLASEDKLSETRARDLIEAIYQKASGEKLSSAVTRDFLTSWAKSTEGVLSIRTHQAYAQVARDFIAHLDTKADRDLSHITTADVTRFRDAVAKRTSKANASKQLKYLRIGLGEAWRQNLLRDNPAAKVKVFPRKESARRPFQLSEIRKVFSHADGEWQGMILFGYYTGQRLSDISQSPLH